MALPSEYSEEHSRRLETELRQYLGHERIRLFPYPQEGEVTQDEQSPDHIIALDNALDLDADGQRQS